MERLRPYPVTALCALTLVIWTTRIPLAWTNDEDSVGEKVLWTLPITAFWAAAAVLLAVLAADRSRTTPWFATVAKAFAIGTIAYWAVRLPMILVAEPPASVDSAAAFKVVHAVLAAASISSAALAWRSLRPGAPGHDAEPRPAAA